MCFIVDGAEHRNIKPVLDATTLFVQNNEPAAKKASEAAVKV